MPERPWPDLLREHPMSHLVVAVVEGVPARFALGLVTKLLEGLDLRADYAVTLIEEAGGPTLQCAFDSARDAEQFAAAVGAQEIDRQPGWASRRSFKLDQATLSAMTDVLEAAPV